MFESKNQKAEPGLLRLQKDINRDKLRLQQRLGLVNGEPAPDDGSRPRTSGKLYKVFVAMGEV